MLGSRCRFDVSEFWETYFWLVVARVGHPPSWCRLLMVQFWMFKYFTQSKNNRKKISTEGLSLTHRSTCTCISEDWKHCYKFLPRPAEFWLANAATYNPQNTRDLSIYSTRGRGLLSRWAPLPWVMLKDTSKA